MIVLYARNPQVALPVALHILQQRGVERDSRYGKVLVVDEPVVTVYSCPIERVIYHVWRNANPFFHFYESLWMLAGRDDVAPLARYAKRMATFSDDGKKFNAAYGRRWRWAHDCMGIYRDQLVEIANSLSKNNDDRRQVLQIWDLKRDLGYNGKDAACNLTATFQIGCDGRLNMVVFCRSNDIIWGCYGANAVHFSMLLEYMASRVGVKVGTYTQISVNWHGYLETAGPMLEFHAPSVDDVYDPYEMEPGDCRPYPLSDGKLDDTWDEDCRNFVTDTGRLPVHAMFKNRFFADVAWPIVSAHDLYKDGKIEEAMVMIMNCQALDWRQACFEWLQRRLQKKMKAENEQNYGSDGSGGW